MALPGMRNSFLGTATKKKPPLPQSIGMRTTFRGPASNNYRPPVKPVARPAAPAPAAAAQPLERPAPPDPIYDSQLGDIARARDVNVMGLGTARQQGLADYGYTEDQATGALAVDPNNPFGKAAELKRRYDVSRRSTGQSMGSGGQLYAGAYQNAQDLVNRNQLGAQDSLQKSLAAFLAGNTRDRMREQSDYTIGVGKLDAERMARIKDNPLYDATIGGAEAPIAAGKKAAPKPDQQAKGGKYKWPDGKGYVHSRPYMGR